MSIRSVQGGGVASDDPVKQIRNLIRDLDSELLQLTRTNQRTRAISQLEKKNHQSKNVKENLQTSKTNFGNQSKSFLEIRKKNSADAIKGPSVNISRSLSAVNKSIRIVQNTTSRALRKIPKPQSLNTRTTVSKQALHYKSTKEPTIEYNLITTPCYVRLDALRAKVVDAYRNRRIFSIFGNYHTIRNCLCNRGWVEKLAAGRTHKFEYLPNSQLLALARPGNDFEAIILSRLAKDFPAFFVWQAKGQQDLYSDVLPYRNRIRRGRSLDFTTKIGLVGCTFHEQWYNQDEVSHMNFPRLYRLSANNDERLAFIDDYKLTQCRALIHFVNEKIESGSCPADEKAGSIHFSILHYALDKIKTQFEDKENQIIDVANCSNNSSESWKQFLKNSERVIKLNAKFKAKVSELIEFNKTSSEYLKKLYEKITEYNWDGVRNLWILKPGYSSRGIGIIIRSSLDDILNIAKNYPQKYYIAQKYIERPLLVYKTKFDIRQYLLVVINDLNVTLWMYKDCYFRFSSQEYNMDDLRESIHLTNNCVQRRYRNKIDRDKRLPRHNMWSLVEFENYLKLQNKPVDFWKNFIYSGMKANLVAVVMASMEDTNFIPNSFELYGCDFMLDENYRPILIEVNSSPDLSPSTPVTKRICPNALRDLIKVVIDFPRNSKVSTGLFEKIFSINYRTNQNFDPKIGLLCSGRQIKLLSTKTNINKSETNIETDNKNLIKKTSSPMQPNLEEGTVLMDTTISQTKNLEENVLLNFSMEDGKFLKQENINHGQMENLEPNNDIYEEHSNTNKLQGLKLNEDIKFFQSDGEKDGNGSKKSLEGNDSDESVKLKWNLTEKLQEKSESISGNGENDKFLEKETSMAYHMKSLTLSNDKENDLAKDKENIQAAKNKTTSVVKTDSQHNLQQENQHLQICDVSDLPPENETPCCYYKISSKISDDEFEPQINISKGEIGSVKSLESVSEKDSPIIGNPFEKKESIASIKGRDEFSTEKSFSQHNVDENSQKCPHQKELIHKDSSLKPKELLVNEAKYLKPNDNVTFLQPDNDKDKKEKNPDLSKHNMIMGKANNNSIKNKCMDKKSPTEEKFEVTNCGMHQVNTRNRIKISNLEQKEGSLFKVSSTLKYMLLKSFKKFQNIKKEEPAESNTSGAGAQQDRISKVNSKTKTS